MITEYASGNWLVKSGSEDDFIARWTELLEWTRSNGPGLHSMQLIRDREDDRHFVSFASWESLEALERWRSHPEFAVRLSACRALCEEFRGSNYTLAATA